MAKIEALLDSNKRWNSYPTKKTGVEEAIGDFFEFASFYFVPMDRPDFEDAHNKIRDRQRRTIKDEQEVSRNQVVFMTIAAAKTLTFT